MYLTGKKIIHPNRRQIIEKTKFTYSPLGLALEKQTEKQVGALKSLSFYDKTDELEQIESISPQNLMNDLILYRSKEIK